MSLTFKTGPKVKLTYTADQWELYDKPGRGNVAIKLNHGMEARIHLAPTRREFKLGDLLDKHAAFGAADSEGYRMVEYILDKAYPE